NKADTSTTITSDNPDPSVSGQTITVKYAVSVTAPGAGTPTGTVTITDADSAATCSDSVATGQCDLVLASAGTHHLTATYAGDGNFNATSRPENHQVNKADTSTSLTSSANPSVFGQSVTFTATVSVTSPGAGTPSGTVTFKEGSTTLGTGTLSSGQATFSTS